jgi:hypothetical protein
MTPLIKKTLFRIKKLNRPFVSEQSRRKRFIAKNSLKALTALITFLIVAGVVFLSRIPVRFLLN